MIEAYSFGSMTVDGRVLRRDLLLVGGRVVENWWRGEGHLLTIGDLGAILDAPGPLPEVLVVGTGAQGVMRLAKGLAEELGARGMELVAEPTGQAWKTYDSLLRAGRSVAGAFHLTC
ncbi:protein of unknown function DUF498 [Desulfovibrio sp. X2]|uniref:MTH938/NDUFAF3 family protein n=1 Tax=Desulfovibrio sp. X2 TaxID=941449 RepID=UPI0003588494|nr:MTH938/NDUFAF3 family protein [Desulfovibrio sp. X2]EPR37552.1 protein of unknown function DUF498 [Desulfovibrio sp. X2]